MGRSISIPARATCGKGEQLDPDSAWHWVVRAFPSVRSSAAVFDRTWTPNDIVSH